MKILLLIGMMLLVGSSDFVFAEWEEDESSFEDMVYVLLQILNWLWIIPSILAGTFMSNELIYGASFNLDVYLWQIWNMMKNFANFTLWFIFLFVIIKTFFYGEPASVLKNYLPKILVGWVLINFTWFLVGIIVDISMVATAAVGQLPQKTIEDELEEEVEVPVRCTFNLDFEEDWEMEMDHEYLQSFCDPPEDGDGGVSLGEMSASATNMSWPLLYVGMSILEIQEMWSSEAQTGDVLIKWLINLFIILLFVIPIFILAVINFIRIFWIWAFIVFSPFIVLDFIFGNVVSQKMEWAAKKLTISNFVGLVFQPVVVIGALSLILVFLNTMSSALTNPWEEEEVSDFFNFQDDTWDGNEATVFIDEDEGAQFRVEWEFVDQAGQYVGWSFGWLFMSLISIFLVWSLIKVSFKTSEITSGVTDSITKFVEDSVKATPIPGTNISYGALEKFGGQLERNTWWALQREQGKEWVQAVQNMFGSEETQLTETHRNELDRALGRAGSGQKLDYFFEKIREIWAEWHAIRWDDRVFRDTLAKAINESSDNIQDWLRAHGFYIEDWEVDLDASLNNDKAQQVVTGAIQNHEVNLDSKTGIEEAYQKWEIQYHRSRNLAEPLQE